MPKLGRTSVNVSFAPKRCTMDAASQLVLQRCVVDLTAEQRALPLRAISSIETAKREGMDKRHAVLGRVHRKQRRELLLKQHAM